MEFALRAEKGADRGGVREPRALVYAEKLATFTQLGADRRRIADAVAHITVRDGVHPAAEACVARVRTGRRQVEVASDADMNEPSRLTPNSSATGETHVRGARGRRRRERCPTRGEGITLLKCRRKIDADDGAIEQGHGDVSVREDLVPHDRADESAGVDGRDLERPVRIVGEHHRAYR